MMTNVILLNILQKGKKWKICLNILKHISVFYKPSPEFCYLFEIFLLWRISFNAHHAYD
jgi:hypothetical protein